MDSAKSHFYITPSALSLSAWTEHSGKTQAVLYFRAMEIFLSPSRLAPRQSVKERSHSRDTDPTPGDDPPGISSLAQTSRCVRLTAADFPLIKAF